MYKTIEYTLCEHSIVMNQKIRDASTDRYKKPAPAPLDNKSWVWERVFILYSNTLLIKRFHFDSSWQALPLDRHCRANTS